MIFFLFCYILIMFYIQHFLFQPDFKTFFLGQFSFFHFNLVLDFYTQSFICFVIYIGSMIIMYSNYYMTRFESHIFIAYLYNFINFMIFLVAGDNLFTMFMGWEGVGIMSFLLISWYSAREKASFSAKKAIIYNRFADFFFLFLICLEIFENNSLFWGEVFMNKDEMSNSLFFSQFKYLVMFSFLFSIMGKSAQFCFHPWLTSAMEGPTPVSALLHSSTMVVAGVFLFFKLHFFLMTNFSVILVLLFVSALTNMLSSVSAFFFKDQKKVIALSTTSQLSFMIFLLCLGEKEMGFFHMILHGFFKALLFLSSGIFIHQSSNYQNYYMQSVSSSSSIFFSKVFFFSNWGLLGLPFFGAFWSKHSLLILWGSHNVGVSALIFLFTSFVFTMGYTLRLSVGSHSPLKSMTFTPKFSLNIFALTPVIGLLLGVFFVGWFFKNQFLFSGGMNFYPKYLDWFLPMIFFLGSLLFIFFKEVSFFWHFFFFSSQINRFFFFLLSKANLRFLETSLEKMLPLSIVFNIQTSLMKQSYFKLANFNMNFFFLGSLLFYGFFFFLLT